VSIQIHNMAAMAAPQLQKAPEAAVIWLFSSIPYRRDRLRGSGVLPQLYGKHRGWKPLPRKPKTDTKTVLQTND
jgi:hypothetical protein